PQLRRVQGKPQDRRQVRQVPHLLRRGAELAELLERAYRFPVGDALAEVPAALLPHAVKPFWLLKRSTSQRSQQLIQTFGVVAQEHHIAACGERSLCALRRSPGDCGAFHRQVVAEDEPVELELPPQNLLQPVL